jgi:hypothetical protein
MSGRSFQVEPGALVAVHALRIGTIRAPSGTDQMPLRKPLRFKGCWASLGFVGPWNLKKVLAYDHPSSLRYDATSPPVIWVNPS